MLSNLSSGLCVIVLRGERSADPTPVSVLEIPNVLWDWRTLAEIYRKYLIFVFGMLPSTHLLRLSSLRVELPLRGMLAALLLLMTRGWAQQGVQSKVHSGDSRSTSAWSWLTDWRGTSLLKWAETFPWPQSTTHLAFTLRYKPHEHSPRIELTIAPAQISERRKNECERKAKVLCYFGEEPAWERECCAEPFSDCGWWVDQCLEDGGCPGVFCFTRLFWPLAGVPNLISAPHATRHLIEAAEEVPLASGEYLSIIWRVAPTEEVIVDTIKLRLYDIPMEAAAAQTMPLSIGIGMHFLRGGSSIFKKSRVESGRAQVPFPYDGCMGKDQCLEWMPSPGKPYNYILMVGRPRPRTYHPRLRQVPSRSFPGKLQVRPEGTVYIEFPEEGPWTLRLWDMQGRLIETLTGLYRSFEFSHTLPDGVYRVEIMSASGQVYSRTILIRSGS